MRTPDQRGRYGRWLVAARESRGWDTAQKALDALAAAGIRIGKSTYAEYESGSKIPSRNHLPLLETFWGPVTEPERVDSDDLIAALRDQTAAIGSLVSAMAGSRVVEARAPYLRDVDARTLKARRAYWIARALDETRITRPKLRLAVGLPAGRETTLARWVAGDIPSGAELERFARALMLPLRVLQDPPETDHERLVEWRREAIAELPAPELEVPERKRRSA